MTETKYEKREENGNTFHTSVSLAENYKYVTTHQVFNEVDMTVYNSAVFNGFGELIRIYGLGTCNKALGYIEHAKDHRHMIQQFKDLLERKKSGEIL
jgi:hypothetical protein